MHVGAAGGAGEGEADELGGLADGTGVGVGVALVVLGAGGEAVLGGEAADLVEPIGGVVEVVVVLGEVVAERGDRVGVDGGIVDDALVGRAGEQGEQLGEEEAVRGAEVRPLAQVLAGIRDAVAFDGEGAQREVGLGAQDVGQFGVVTGGPVDDGGEDLRAGAGGDVVCADVLELDQVDQGTGDAALLKPDRCGERIGQGDLGEAAVGQAA